jgi:hypothetical protein
VRRSTAILLAAGLLAAACAGPAAQSPSPTATAANQIVFTADLKATNEVPPIANDERNASGTAMITFDLTRDSGGRISGATAKFDVSVKDLASTSRLTIAHIHEGASGVNGGVKVNTGLTADTAPAVSGGATTFAKSAISVEGTLAQSIVDNPANFYMNVHSALNPGGVVRGQLVKRP